MSPRALLALGVLSVGAAAPLIRLAHAPPLTAAFLRTVLGGVILVAIVLARRLAGRDVTLPRGRDLARALVCGAVLGVHFALWFVSLTMTTVAASTVLVCIQPVFVALLAFVILQERTPPRGVLGIGVAIAGAALIAVDGSTGTAPAAHPALGNALAVAGAFVVAFYPIFGRQQDKRTDAIAFSAAVSLSAGAVLLVVALVYKAPLVTPDASWPALLALAIVPTVVGQTALNAALRELPASMVAGAILGEPVIATLVAFFVLMETPGAYTIAGSAVVLVGLYLLTVQARAAT